MKSSSLSGVVVCGGKSTRMGTDKSLLEYHGIAQRYYLFDLLSNYCNEVIISCNDAQAAGMDPHYPYVVDSPAWQNVGPVAGVLSAAEVLNGDFLVVVGCDYPLVIGADIKLLTDQARQTGKSAAFRNEDGIIEPLVSVLNRQDIALLEKNIHAMKGSLRKFFEEFDTLIIDHPQPQRLKSVDDVEAYERMMHMLQNRS